MNLQTFFDNFELLAEVPNGVQKLRELILQLAVMGKLAPQDPKDEPACILLEKIACERELLINEGKISKIKSLPSITTEEFPFMHPIGWSWERFGKIADIVSGVTKGRNLVGRKTAFYPYIRVANVQRGFLDLKVIKEIEIPIEELEKYSLKVGDILLTEGGDWDKLGRSAIWEGDIQDCIHQNHIFRARLLNSGFLSEWAVLFTNSLIGRKYFETASKKTTNLASINMNQLRNCPFPIPPSNEQHRIVAKVEQLMKLCDELEARQQKKREARVTINNTGIAQLLTAREPEEFSKSWQRIYNNFDLLYSTPENIGKLRSCILQLAVMGKLAPQNLSDEPASVLLEKIKAEKELLVKEGKIKKEKPLPTIAVEQLPYEIPQGWRWIRLAEISKTIEYGTSEKSSDIGDVPMFRMNNIRDGKIIFENLKFVDDSIKDLPRLYLQDKDLLFNRTNSYDLVGKTGVFRGESYRYTFASYLIRISLFSVHINPELINMVINSYYFRQTQIQPEITQQCGQANFNGTKLKNTIIPLPPLAEQHRIVAKVTQLVTLCDQIEAQLKQSVTDSEKLMETTVCQLLDVNTIVADGISVQPNKLETKTVKQSSQKIQSHEQEAVQLNLPLF